jgi:hypothetical protein
MTTYLRSATIFPGLVLVLLGAAACDPQNAQLVDGDYTAWLSLVSSVTLDKEVRKAGGFEEFQKLWSEGNEGGRAGAIDCRDVREKLPNAERFCNNENKWPPEQERWLADDGWIVVGDTMEPWRGEAVLTSEGDAQIGFHVELPQGRDFRFQFVVDPDFQPRSCQENEEGTGVEYAPVDGDWIAEWSAGQTGTLFFLNANAVQFDPGTVLPSDGSAPPPSYAGPRFWQFPNEWEAGFAQGRFADDLLTLRPTRYFEPAAYTFVGNDFSSDFPRADQSFYGCPDIPPGETLGSVCASDTPEDDALCTCYDTSNGQSESDQAAHVENTADEVERELRSYLAPEDREGVPSLRPRTHTNAWRPADFRAPGVDGWAELSSSWVLFDEGSSFEPGGEASGEFVVFLDGSSDRSRVLVRGRFEVNGWSKDFWTTDYLPPIKFDENDTTLCGSTEIP